MGEEPVSYELLADLLRTERRGNNLSPLKPRFWAEVRGYLKAVEDEFRDEQARDPFSRRVMMFTDRVKNTRQAAAGLWALRERKLAIRALAHVTDGKRPEGMTPSESELYDQMLTLLRTQRDKIFEGTSAATRPVLEAAAAPGPAERGTGGAKGRGKDLPPTPKVPADAPTAGDGVTIRALGDIPPFVGPDMQTYVLKDGDLADVPQSIADLLVKRKKAALVETA